MSSPVWASEVSDLVEADQWEGDVRRTWIWRAEDVERGDALICTWDIDDVHVRLDSGTYEAQAEHHDDIPTTMRALLAGIDAFNRHHVKDAS